MARQNASTPTDADAVVSADAMRVVLPVTHSASACAGAATGFLLRRIAYKAGAYAPGIQEFLFHDLTTPAAGRSLDAVTAWMAQHTSDLHAMGYRVQARRVSGERTDAILQWVREGHGFRGALLSTEYGRLHPAEGDVSVEHAVAVAVDKLDDGGKDDVVMIDPWPGTKNGARDRGPVSPKLESAHRASKYGAMIFYWVGYS